MRFGMLASLKKKKKNQVDFPSIWEYEKKIHDSSIPFTVWSLAALMCFGDLNILVFWAAF